MNCKERMILIDEKIVTSDLDYSHFTDYNTYQIKFKNSEKCFYYSKNRVKVLKKPEIIDIKMYRFYYKGKILKNIDTIYQFKFLDKKYYHITYNNGTKKDYKYDEIKVLESVLNNPTSKTVFNYLKELANILLINGENILGNQYNKIDFLDQKCVLNNYLMSLDNEYNKNAKKDLIFPFGCNLSQYNAVYNAIENKISIIEGPPGTGKTQTILNILANLILRNKTCQVVSNNNSAIENIEEKLKQYDLDFFVALLGNNENKIDFITNQKKLPVFVSREDVNLNELQNKINELNEVINIFYSSQKELAILKQELSDVELEYKYFNKFVLDEKILLLDFKYNRINRMIKIWNELSESNSINFIQKLKYIFIYKTGNYKFYNNKLENIIFSLQNKIYTERLKEINNKIEKINIYLTDNKKYEKEYVNLSMEYFKTVLWFKYKEGRKDYALGNIKKDYKEFLKDYPVILSTTFSSRNSFSSEVKFDYIIMDESSQIDIVTGALAFSSANNAVVIGDEMQLPNFVTGEIKQKTDAIFKKFNINEGYSYSKNSFLTSIKLIVKNIPITLLQEHYRCHPKIINFCNKKFYNDKLIIMTEDNKENDVIKIIKTNEGNHSRERMNERQIDIIKDLLPSITYESIGIIAPYKNQVETIKKEIPNVEVNTIHKFQGREKDVIIISTVEDAISDFVDGPNILNVAISRAKKQLILIVTGNDIKNTNINDFIEYANYNNFEIENSKVNSIFDFLYKQYTDQRIGRLKKYKKISKYDSENLMYSLICDILKEYDNLFVACHVPLYPLINDKSLLTEEEHIYVSNFLTHLDFLIYNKITKKPVLAIEVDGYKYHKEGTKQLIKDKLKDNILMKYEIDFCRFKTTGSNEKEKIIEKLEKC